MSNVVSNIEFAELTGGADRTPALGERLDLIGHVKVKLTVALGAAELRARDHRPERHPAGLRAGPAGEGAPGRCEHVRDRRR